MSHAAMHKLTFHSPFILKLLKVNDGLLIQIAGKKEVWWGVCCAYQAHSCIVQLINQSDESASLVTHLQSQSFCRKPKENPLRQVSYQESLYSETAQLNDFTLIASSDVLLQQKAVGQAEVCSTKTPTNQGESWAPSLSLCLHILHGVAKIGTFGLSDRCAQQTRSEHTLSDIVGMSVRKTVWKVWATAM